MSHVLNVIGRATVLFLFLGMLMVCVPAIVCGIHDFWVFVTRRGTHRLLLWPDYAAIPVSLAVWIVFGIVAGTGKKSLSNMCEPILCSLIWSALLLIRSLVNLITQRKPSHFVAGLSAVVLLGAMVLVFFLMPCLPE